MFRQFAECFWGFFGTISAIAEELCTEREREMNVFHFSDIFSALKFCLADGDISICILLHFRFMSICFVRFVFLFLLG
jgi:hypothetical protein